MKSKQNIELRFPFMPGCGSGDAFCLKGAQLIWREPHADGDEVTAQVLDLRPTIKRVPLHAPNYTPNAAPDGMQMIAFAPSGDYVSAATHTTTPAKAPGEVWVLLRVGHHSVRRWCDFILKNQQALLPGGNKVSLLD